MSEDLRRAFYPLALARSLSGAGFETSVDAEGNVVVGHLVIRLVYENSALEVEVKGGRRAWDMLDVNGFIDWFRAEGPAEITRHALLNEDPVAVAKAKAEREATHAAERANFRRACECVEAVGREFGMTIERYRIEDDSGDGFLGASDEGPYSEVKLCAGEGNGVAVVELSVNLDLSAIDGFTSARFAGVMRAVRDLQAAIRDAGLR